MAKLHVTDAEGKIHLVEAAANGDSIMDILRFRGFSVGLCGGNCSCGTCAATVEKEWVPMMVPPGRSETEMLSQGTNNLSGIRLTCQILFTEALDGIRLELVRLE